MDIAHAPIVFRTVTSHQYPRPGTRVQRRALTASTILDGSRFRLTPIVRCIASAGGESGGAADSVEGVKVLLVGVGQGIQVFLRGGDLGVTHPVHDGL